MHLRARTLRRALPAVPAVTAGVLGLLAAAGTGLLALVLRALAGDLGGTDGGDGALPLLLGAVALLQGTGAVLLLCRRGWLLLAVGSLPGTVVLGRLLLGWTEHASPPSVPEFTGAASALALVLCLTPAVRNRARRPAAGGARSGGNRGKP